MADEQQQQSNIFDQAAEHPAGVAENAGFADDGPKAESAEGTEGTADAKPFDNLVAGAPLDTFKNPDGSYDVAKLSEAYVDLSKNYSNIDKLREGWQKEYENQLLSQRPEKIEDYEMPTLPEGFDYKEDIEDNPMFGWWRENCYNNGKDSTYFQEGINQFLGFMNELAPNPKEEFEKLGEHAEQRTNAVALWASNFFPAAELEAVRILGTTAEGIAALERIMNAGAQKAEGGEGIPMSNRRLTRMDLDEMMADPRYHDPARRDPEWVKKVDEGFRQLVGR